MKIKWNLLTVFVLLAMLWGGAASSVQAAIPADAPYIIVFKDTVNPAAEAPGLAKAYGLQPGFIYQDALKGMSAVVPAGRLAALQHDPRVAYVVEDMQRSISAQAVPTGIQRIFADENLEIGMNGSDDYRVDVDVAVIDTGIDFQHPDLNVVGGVICEGSFLKASCKAGGDDDHYHGTHVAGTIGALDNGIGVVGVAPGARLWAVKVLDSRGSGWSSEIIAGINWVAANAATIEVANMSLGGSGFSQAEYDAIQGAVNKGVAFAVAAGNNDADARNYSPGGFNNVLSVSALADFDGEPGGLGSPTCRTDQDDTLADFSNWGPEIDVAAPGVCILSTYPLEQGEYGTISGTSMASPHAAGALALLASANNPGNAIDVYNLYNQVKSAGNSYWTDDSGDGIKEPLLDVHDSTIFNPVLVPGSGGGGNTPPIVSITNPQDGATVSGSSVNITASASDDGTVTQVEFFITSASIGVDMDGTDGWSALWDLTNVADGAYTLKAVATDDAGAAGSDSHTVTVNNVPDPAIKVVGLTGSSVWSKVGVNWKATVSVTLDPTLGGAVVTGTWSNGTTGTCTTVVGGTCSIALSNINKKVSSVTFRVTSVALAGYVYDPSGVTTVTVYKPQ